MKSDFGGNVGGVGEFNLLLENDGTGTFTDVTATAFVPFSLEDNSVDAELVDLDSDGDLDIVVANSFASLSPSVSGDVWINQGGAQGGTEGVFVDDPMSALDQSTPADIVRLSIETGDIESDGDVDVFISVHDLAPGGDQLLFLNQGGAQGGTVGDLSRQNWFDPADVVSGGGAFLDVDHDGDLDLLFTASGTISGGANPLAVRLLINHATP